ncbi:MAG: hypothetical protein L0Y56_05400, partial [Nitrospira sp.]|nr:hypothetical protein [Nitrospira sp.]
AIPDWESRDPTLEEVEAYAEEALTIVREIEAPVLAVALGDEIDQGFLRAISQGRYLEADTALDLPAVYLDILSNLQDRSIIPGYNISPNETILDISSYAKKVGFIVVKESPSVMTTLYPPDTDKPLDLAASGIVHLNEAMFEVIIVPELPPGSWRMALSGGQADVRAIIISSQLQLDLLTPARGAACAGQPWILSASLNLIGEDGSIKPITEAAAQESLNAEITLPNGQVRTLAMQPMVDDTFSTTFDDTHQPGAYQIVLKSSTDELAVRLTDDVIAISCPGLEIVTPVDGASLALEPDQEFAIEVHLSWDENTFLDMGHVVALVTTTDGSQVELTLADVGQGQYRGMFRPETTGQFQIQAKLSDDAIWKGLPIQAETKVRIISITQQVPTPIPTLTPTPTPVPVLPTPASNLSSEPTTNFGQPWTWWVIPIIALGILILLFLWRWIRQPRLEGTLYFGRRGIRPDYLAVKGKAVHLKTEGKYLTTTRSQRGAQVTLRVEPYGDVRLLPRNGMQITKNHIPVPPEGSLVGSRDVIQLEELEIRFENHNETSLKWKY